MKFTNKMRFVFLKPGFTLAEAIATLAIAAMIMAVAVGIYTGVRRAEAAVNRRLKGGMLATEVLQRIAEDVDRLILNGADVMVTIKNKTEQGGYKSAQMVIESKFYDKDNQLQTFEKVVWQSRADIDVNGLVIYRSHSGYAMEDKMLDEPKEQYEREKFIPICGNATMFQIDVVSGDTTVDKWESKNLPTGLKVSVSFEPMQQDLLGDMTVPEEAITTRTIVTDRFRLIPYQFVAMDIPDINDINDMNDMDYSEPNEPNDLDPNRVPEALQ